MSLSLTCRAAMYAESTDEVAVWLVTITHPDLAAPVRLSTDPTARLSDDPLTYGTVSRGDAYLFAAAHLVLPDDEEGVPPSGTLVFADVGPDAVALIRSIATAPSITIELVLASAPDHVERRWSGLKVPSADYDATGVSLAFSREVMLSQPWPRGRMTKQRFPGLYA